MRRGKIVGQGIEAVHTDRFKHIAIDLSARTAPPESPCRRLLSRPAPAASCAAGWRQSIPSEQIAKLSGCNRHHTLGRRWPDEPAPLQSLREQTQTLGIMPQDLDQIAAPAAEDEQDARHRDHAAAPLGPVGQGRSCHGACRCGRWRARPAPHSGTGSSSDQRPQRCRHRRRIESTRDAGHDRRPAARSRSAREAVRRDRLGGTGRRQAAGDAILTAAKPGILTGRAGRSASAPSRLRQVKSWLGLTPYRRATPCTVSPAANVSATSRRLSSSDQRRRARPRKISTRAMRSLQGLV